MSTSSIKNPLIVECLEQIEPINEHTHRITDGLNDQQFNWQPPEGGWSIAMVFEHLVVSAEEYDGIVLPLLERAAADSTRSDDYVWKPSFMGKMLHNAVKPESTRKVKAPGKFVPLAPRDRVVDVFLDQQNTLQNLMRNADGLNLKRIRFGTPVTRLLRLNIGDYFAIMVTHARRHLLQAQRVTEHSDFPANPA